MPRHTILKVRRRRGQAGLAARQHEDRPASASSSPPGGVHPDRHPGRQHDPSPSTRSGPSWRITDGVTGSKVRPAAYKTGTTSDNKDVHAYGYLAPPVDKKLPALVAGVWMGNSDNTPNDGKLSLDTSAPLWSAILSDVSKGMPIEGFSAHQAQGPRHRDGRRVHRHEAERRDPPHGRGAVHRRAPSPRTAASYVRAVDVDAASGLRWREGCVGPDGHQVVHGLQQDRGGLQVLAEGRRRAGRPARRAAPGSSGGPKGTRTAYFYGGGFYPFGRSLGRHGSPPTKKCPLAPPEPTPCVSTSRPRLSPDGPNADDDEPATATATAARSRPRSRRAGRTTRRVARLRAGRSSPRRRPRPAPRVATLLTSGCAPACARTASRSAPVPRPWMISTCSRPASDGVVQVAVQRLERLVDPGAAQVQRRGDGCGPR